MALVETALKYGTTLCGERTNKFMDTAGVFIGVGGVVSGEEEFDLHKLIYSALFGGFSSDDTFSGDAGEVAHNFGLSWLKNAAKAVPGVNAVFIVQHLAKSITELSRAIASGEPLEKAENIMEGITEFVAAATMLIPGGALASGAIQMAVRDVINKTVIRDLAKEATKVAKVDLVKNVKRRAECQQIMDIYLKQHPKAGDGLNPTQLFEKILTAQPELIKDYPGLRALTRELYHKRSTQMTAKLRDGFQKRPSNSVFGYTASTRFLEECDQLKNQGKKVFSRTAGQLDPNHGIWSHAA